jgi:tetratricopeptide (TPR) repeat protein
MLDLSGLLSRLGDFPEAREQADESVKLLRELVAAPEPLHPRDRLMLTIALEARAVALRELGEVDAALDAFEEHVARARDELKTDPNADNNAANFLNRALLERARTLALRPGRRAEAEASLAEAVEGWDRLAADHPAVVVYRHWAGVVRVDRGGLRVQLGRHDDAEADLTAARAALAALAEAHPSVPAYRGDLGRCLAEQGRLALARNDPGTARGHFAGAIEHLDAAVTASPEDALYRRERERAQADRDRAGGPPPG